jgi:hypothetical protein
MNLNAFLFFLKMTKTIFFIPTEKLQNGMYFSEGSKFYSTLGSSLLHRGSKLFHRGSNFL